LKVQKKEADTKGNKATEREGKGDKLRPCSEHKKTKQKKKKKHTNPNRKPKKKETTKKKKKTKVTRVKQQGTARSHTLHTRAKGAVERTFEEIQEGRGEIKQASGVE